MIRTTIRARRSSPARATAPSASGSGSSMRRSGDSAFAEASALYPPDMSEWQAAVYLLSGCEEVWGELGGRVMRERSIAPVIEELESPRRPWGSSEDAVMQSAGDFWDVERWPAKLSSTCSNGSSSTAGSRRAICANASRPRAR